jgi:hypothetical protein
MKQSEYSCCPFGQKWFLTHTTVLPVVTARCGKTGLPTSAWYELYVDATRINLSLDKITAPCGPHYLGIQPICPSRLHTVPGVPVTIRNRQRIGSRKQSTDHEQVGFGTM